MKVKASARCHPDDDGLSVDVDVPDSAVAGLDPRSEAFDEAVEPYVRDAVWELMEWSWFAVPPKEGQEGAQDGPQAQG